MLLRMVILAVALAYRSHSRVPASILILWGQVIGYGPGWSLISGPRDSTGLWGAGLLFLTMRLTAGLGTVIVLTQLARRFDYQCRFGYQRRVTH